MRLVCVVTQSAKFSLTTTIIFFILFRVNYGNLLKLVGAPLSIAYEHEELRGHAGMNTCYDLNAFKY